MRFLYFGDKHSRVTAPENRLDNFRETMRAKTLEIKELGKKYKVSAFLQPGDFWDSPNPPLDFVAEEMKLWTDIDIFEVLRQITSGKEYNTEDLLKSLKNYIPIIGVVGNHELYGNNINTLPKTVAGFISQLGLMTFVTKDSPYYFYTEDGLTIAITGTHYHLDIDSPEHIDDYIIEEKLGDFHIHIVHGYLTDKSKGDLFRHTLIDQIKHTKADLTITGHDHIGFPIIEIDGKYFANPGAIPRLSNDLKEMNRTVKVLLIDITKEHGLRLKEIPLKSAQPGHLVLSRSKIVERKQKETRLEEFKKAVREAGVKKATDITEIVRNIADNRKLPTEVKENTIQRISEKMREMAHSTDGMPQEVYITKMVLENFQSHEFTELDFSKGFNILIGESRQGKTAVLRAFDWVYENKPAGKRIIRRGKDFARVTLYLSNGYIISRYMEAKRNGKNGYEITDPNTGEVQFHNTKILPEVQKLLGFTCFQIDKDLQLNLNFLKQGTSWFLIGDQYSAPQKAKIIGGIYGTQFADAVIRDIDAETKRTNEKIKSINEELLQTENRLKEFGYLPELKESIDFVERTIKEIEELQLKKERIQKLLDKREQIVSHIRENESILSRLKDLDKVHNLLSQLKEDVAKRNRLEELIQKHNDVSYRLKHLYASLEAVKQIDEAKKELQETMEMMKRRDNIERLMTKYEGYITNIKEQEVIVQKTKPLEEAKKIFNEINNLLLSRKELEEKIKRAEELEAKREKCNISVKAIYLTLEKTKYIEQARNRLEEIKSYFQQREEIEKRLLSREKLIAHIRKEEQIIENATQQISKDVQMYQQVLEKAGKCPVCFGTIDKATINRIVHEYVHNHQEGEVVVYE
jgi:DNA repair protein SbcC/Rad50